MLAVGVAIVVGGGVQTALLVAEGAAEHSARLQREQKETLAFLAPLVADQALVGEYAAISQLLKNQVKKGEVDSFKWTDRDGKTLVAQDAPDTLDAPTLVRARRRDRARAEQSVEVTAGGVGYGTLSADMTPVKANNRLWQQFVKQLQIVAVTLFLMLQFIWLIFRGNLGTLRMLAEGANRFSQGDHAVRIEAEGAPEVALGGRGVQQHGEQHREPDRLPRQERIEEQAARRRSSSSRAKRSGPRDLGGSITTLELGRRVHVRLSADRGDRPRAQRWASRRR